VSSPSARIMRFAVYGAILLGIIAVVLMSLLPSAPRQLPDLVLEDLHGQPVPLQNLVGEPVVINLWATWCEPCRREMPVLQAAQQARDDVHLLFVNVGESNATIAGYLAADDLNLANVLRDADNQVGRHFGVHVMPTTLFFGANGNLVALHRGELSEPLLDEYLSSLPRTVPSRSGSPPHG
jgi:thiol-disulfide isomerase/thioredoxin